MNAINSSFFRTRRTTKVSKAPFDSHPPIISLKRKVSLRGQRRSEEHGVVLSDRPVS